MIYDIKIKAVLNGWLVTVGCQSLAFNDIDDMLMEIGEYLLAPTETQTRYKEEAINKELLGGPCQPQAATATECGDAQQACYDRATTATETPTNIGAIRAMARDLTAKY